MPGFGGPALFQQLRGARPNLRALFVSGYSDDPPVPGEGDGAGSRTAFLAKPFKPEELAPRSPSCSPTAPPK